MKKRMGIGLLLVLVLISAATGCTAVWDTGATEDKKPERCGRRLRSRLCCMCTIPWVRILE